MSVHVIDNFYDTENLNNVIQKSHTYKWLFLKSNLENDLFWTIPIYGLLYNTEINYKNFELEEIEELWEEFSNKFKVSKENLHSCYLNGITYGLDAHPHVDFDEQGSTSVIIYLTEKWNSHWGGETVFFNQHYTKDPSNEVFYTHDIIKSILPKYNRMVLFDGNITHAVRHLSKSFKGLRKTIMFKIINIPVEHLMENYKCN